MYQLFRNIIFRLDAETAHHIVLRVLQKIQKVFGVRPLLRKFYSVEHEILATKVAGLTFKNPVGLAAGLDKNAEFVDDLAALGFGFIEIGTVTPLPQPGNDKPRLFRLIEDRGIINRMGFNNQGVDVTVSRLQKLKFREGLLIGGNIGKNKLTPNEDAVKDYLICFDKLYDVVDYYVVNVSSPNTPNLRALQDKEPLTHLLQTLQNRNNQTTKVKPIFLKIAPDLSNEQLDDIVDIISSTKIAGIIATNTTLDRSNLKSPKSLCDESGGLSGEPLFNRSTEVIKYIAKKSNNTFPIIAVGGIHSANQAIEKLQAGATLVQIYTGFVYEGPKLIREINQKILEFRKRTM